MSESDLNTYKLQLQQVEAALTTDPENEVKEKFRNVQTFQMTTNMYFSHFLFSGATAVENRSGASARTDTGPH